MIVYGWMRRDDWGSAEESNRRQIIISHDYQSQQLLKTVNNQSYPIVEYLEWCLADSPCIFWYLKINFEDLSPSYFLSSHLGHHHRDQSGSPHPCAHSYNEVRVSDWICEWGCWSIPLSIISKGRWVCMRSAWLKEKWSNQSEYWDCTTAKESWKRMGLEVEEGTVGWL